ncbi:hypothetical protein [Piscirickettsia salmonis]|uniref:hypothetical protein n=1 Tax=Piscirickettsia salmonis TaxID=1238 RepID=UPI0012BA309C|nr:hypothetical protein [Piscirickettsia salmonis]
MNKLSAKEVYDELKVVSKKLPKYISNNMTAEQIKLFKRESALVKALKPFFDEKMKEKGYKPIEIIENG